MRRICTTTGPARVFAPKEDAQQAIIHNHIEPGDVIFIRYEGAKGSGAPEMLMYRCHHYDRLAYSTEKSRDYRRSFLWATSECMSDTSRQKPLAGRLLTVEDGDLIGNGCERPQTNIVGIDGIIKQKRKYAAVLKSVESRSWKET